MLSHARNKITNPHACEVGTPTQDNVHLTLSTTNTPTHAHSHSQNFFISNSPSPLPTDITSKKTAKLTIPVKDIIEATPLSDSSTFVKGCGDQNQPFSGFAFFRIETQGRAYYFFTQSEKQRNFWIEHIVATAHRANERASVGVRTSATAPSLDSMGANALEERERERVGGGGGRASDASRRRVSGLVVRPISEIDLLSLEKEEREKEGGEGERGGERERVRERAFSPDALPPAPPLRSERTKSEAPFDRIPPTNPDTLEARRSHTVGESTTMKAMDLQVAGKRGGEGERERREIA